MTPYDELAVVIASSLLVGLLPCLVLSFFRKHPSDRPPPVPPPTPKGR